MCIFDISLHEELTDAINQLYQQRQTRYYKLPAYYVLIFISASSTSLTSESSPFSQYYKNRILIFCNELRTDCNILVRKHYNNLSNLKEMYSFVPLLTF